MAEDSHFPLASSISATSKLGSSTTAVVSDVNPIESNSTSHAKPSESATMTRPGGKAKKAQRIPRPMNSFMCFGKEQRKRIQQEHPDLDNKNVSKLLGQQWASLPAAEREIYQAEAQRLAEDHKRLYPDWRFTRDTKKKEKKSRTKDSRSRKPKQPHTTTTTIHRTKPEPMDEDIPPSYLDALDMTPVEPSDVEQLSQFNQLYSERTEASVSYAMDYDSSMFHRRTTSYPSALPDHSSQGPTSSHNSSHSHLRPLSPPMRYVGSPLGSPLDSLSVQHGGGPPPPYCSPPNFQDALGMLLGRELTF